MGLGVVVAIFSLVGFECATAFGTEAKNPRAVIWSLIVSRMSRPIYSRACDA